MTICIICVLAFGQLLYNLVPLSPGRVLYFYSPIFYNYADSTEDTSDPQRVKKFVLGRN